MADTVAVALASLAASGGASMRTATVSAVSGSEVTLSMAGEPVSPTARLSSYTPTVGDTVLLLSDRSGLIIAGKLVSTR